MKHQHKVIILSAPSGSGKTTIAQSILNETELNCSFSVSATSRKPRDYEKIGKHYYFFTEDEFKELIKQDAFVEWEEVYDNQYYGTLKTEVERLFEQEKNILFDVDVEGGLRLKQYFKEHALAVFIMPPTFEELTKRLQNRNTETEHSLQQRILRAKKEITYADKFDVVIVNDVLEHAIEQVRSTISAFFKNQMEKQ